MQSDTVAFSDQLGQFTWVRLRSLLLPFQNELQDFAFELAGTFAASLLRQQGSEASLPKDPPELIEAFSAEAELPACLSNGIPIDAMRPQHFILHLGAVVRVEEIQLFEELDSDALRMGVESS
jgi:hypothetical protein